VTRLMAMIDGSIYSRSVCDHTAWAAGRMDAAVDLVHVLGRRERPSAPANFSGNLSAGIRESLLEELAELDAMNAKAAQKRGRLILDEAKLVLAEDGIEDVTVKLRQGDLVDSLQDLEKDADLVVIGKRGEAADFAKLHLGSNLERVVRSSHIPVLIASRAFKPIKRLLIAFDGQSMAMKAVDHVARDSLFEGMEVHLLTAGSRSAAVEKKQEDAAALLRAGGLTVVSDVIEGAADSVISRYVEDAAIDLLVMGAYGHSRLRSLFIGSITTEMIRSCLIPVLIFR